MCACVCVCGHACAHTRARTYICIMYVCIYKTHYYYSMRIFSEQNTVRNIQSLEVSARNTEEENMCFKIHDNIHETWHCVG